MAAIIIDTPAGIEAYRLLSIKATLNLEVKTGMKYSNRFNVAEQARTVLTKANKAAPKNKAKLLDAYVAHLTAIGVYIPPQPKTQS